MSSASVREGRIIYDKSLPTHYGLYHRFTFICCTRAFGRRRSYGMLKNVKRKQFKHDFFVEYYPLHPPAVLRLLRLLRCAVSSAYTVIPIMARKTATSKFGPSKSFSISITPISVVGTVELNQKSRSFCGKPGQLQSFTRFASQLGTRRNFK